MLLPGTGRGTARRRRVVEGAPPSTRVHNSENYPLKVVEHLRGRDTEGQESQLPQVSVPCRVATGAIAPVVALAVNLDRQTRGQAGEIQ
jgi:hypothetical protein